MKPYGTTVLVVEDDAWIAIDAADQISSETVSVVVVSSVADALKSIDVDRFAGAILDFQVKDGTIEPVRAQLERIGVPYLVVSAMPRAKLTSVGIPADRLCPKPANYQLARDRLLGGMPHARSI